MEVRPVGFREAEEWVGARHRRMSAPKGWKWGLKVVGEAGECLGVVMVGRPPNRNSDDGETVEVVRLVVEAGGPRNVASMLLGAVVRVCREMGWRRVQTYTVEGESGASLRGAGWVCVGETRARRVGTAPRGADMVVRRRWEGPITPRKGWR